MKKEIKEIKECVDTEWYCDVCGEKLDITDNTTIGTSNGYLKEKPKYFSWIHIDICDKCFHLKVLPLLEKELKVKFREEE